MGDNDFDVEQPGLDDLGDQPADDLGDGDPFAGDELAIGAEPEELAVSADELHRTYRLKKPGSLSNTVLISDGELLDPTNTSSCSCTVYIGSFSADGRLIDGSKIKLAPGESLPVYSAAAGAAFIGIACSAGCDPGSDCTCELTVSNAIA